MSWKGYLLAGSYIDKLAMKRLSWVCSILDSSAATNSKNDACSCDVDGEARAFASSPFVVAQLQARVDVDHQCCVRIFFYRNHWNIRDPTHCLAQFLLLWDQCVCFVGFPCCSIELHRTMFAQTCCSIALCEQELLCASLRNADVQTISPIKRIRIS